jgi:hypothetical protein
MTPRGQCTELQRSQEIVTLQVWVVGKHLVDRHTRRQRLEQTLYGIPQTSHRRLTVAYRWIRRDAIESGHISIIAPALQATNPAWRAEEGRGKAGV